MREIECIPKKPNVHSGRMVGFAQSCRCEIHFLGGESVPKAQGCAQARSMSHSRDRNDVRTRHTAGERRLCEMFDTTEQSDVYPSPCVGR